MIVFGSMDGNNELAQMEWLMISLNEKHAACFCQKLIDDLNRAKCDAQSPVALDGLPRFSPSYPCCMVFVPTHEGEEMLYGARKGYSEDRKLDGAILAFNPLETQSLSGFIREQIARIESGHIGDGDHYSIWKALKKEKRSQMESDLEIVILQEAEWLSLM